MSDSRAQREIVASVTLAQPVPPEIVVPLAAAKPRAAATEPLTTPSEDGTASLVVADPPPPVTSPPPPDPAPEAASRKRKARADGGRMRTSGAAPVQAAPSGGVGASNVSGGCWPTPRPFFESPFDEAFASIVWTRPTPAGTYGPLADVPPRERQLSWPAERVAKLESLLPERSRMRARRFRSCAVVGSSPELLLYKDGAAIDGHEVEPPRETPPQPSRSLPAALPQHSRSLPAALPQHSRSTPAALPQPSRSLPAAHTQHTPARSAHPQHSRSPHDADVSWDRHTRISSTAMTLVCGCSRCTLSCGTHAHSLRRASTRKVCVGCAARARGTRTVACEPLPHAATQLISTANVHVARPSSAPTSPSRRASRSMRANARACA
jgi:hypothetical protein